MIIQEPVNGLLQALFLGLGRERVKQSTAVMGDSQTIEETADQLLVTPNEPRLERLGRRVIVGFSSQLGLHPGMAFGTGFSLQDDGTELAAHGEHSQAGAIGGFVVAVEVLKHFARSLLREALQNFVGFHGRLVRFARGIEWENTRESSTAKI